MNGFTAVLNEKPGLISRVFYALILLSQAVLLHNIAVRWAIPACASLVSAASR
jgi:hypothetical protein